MRLIKKRFCLPAILLLFTYSTAYCQPEKSGLCQHCPKGTDSALKKEGLNITNPQTSGNEDTATIKCLTRKEVNQVIQWRYDAETYHNIADSLMPLLDEAMHLVVSQDVLIQQVGKTIQAKEETAAFYKSQAEMRSKDLNMLEKSNNFWRIWAGIATGVAAVFVIKSL
jgi:hypothetical protein